MGKILEKTTTYIVYIEKNSRKISKKFQEYTTYILYRTKKILEKIPGIY